MINVYNQEILFQNNIQIIQYDMTSTEMCLHYSNGAYGDILVVCYAKGMVV